MGLRLTIAEAAKVANAQGVTVTITAPDGSVCRVEPRVDKQKANEFDLVDFRRE